MISFEEYVVNSNPKGADDFLAKWGMTPPKNKEDFYGKVRHVLAHGKEQAFADLAQVPTPYRDMILQFHPGMNGLPTNPAFSNACGCSSGVNGKSNCSGCGGTCGGKSPVEGGAPAAEPTKSITNDIKNIASHTNDALLKTSNKISPYVPLLTTVALAGIFIAIVVKN